MNSMNLLISWSKKILSNIIMLSIMVNIIMFVPIQNINTSNTNQINVIDTISKYYNVISGIPISIVTKFLQKETSKDSIFSRNQTTTKKEKKTNEQSSKENNYDFTDGITVSQQNIQISNLNILFNKYTNILNKIETNSIVIFSQIIDKVLFTGSMILARGDTEDTFYNKYGKINRLV